MPKNPILRHIEVFSQLIGYILCLIGLVSLIHTIWFNQSAPHIRGDLVVRALAILGVGAIFLAFALIIIGIIEAKRYRLK